MGIVKEEFTCRQDKEMWEDEVLHTLASVETDLDNRKTENEILLANLKNERTTLQEKLERVNWEIEEQEEITYRSSQKLEKFSDHKQKVLDALRASNERT